MSCCGTGKLVTFELQNSRLITLDLDCEEEWGDININDDNGEPFIEIGNDEDGYVRAIRFFEELEKDNSDFISSKYHSFGIVSIDDVIEWVMVRMLCFCGGYNMYHLKQDLEKYGIDINNIYIPEEWKR